MNKCIRRATRLVVLRACGFAAAAGGCLTRPVEHADPTTKTVVTIMVPDQAVDKIDMLFDIDNSASMGDKQQYLEQAIPDLIDRLVNPNCTDVNGMPGTPVVKSNNGQGCPAGFKPEFQPVHDMHLGVVTSSLGTRLSDTPAPSDPDEILCPEPSAVGPYPNLDNHNDDQGHLINRSLTLSPDAGVEIPVADATAGFLYWFPLGTPVGPGQAITEAGTPAQAPNLPPVGTLEGDFAALVSGAGIFGCGIESQLESWYRFLTQPDPYQALVLSPAPAGCSGPSCGPAATWSGVDTTILKQRHDFLRPDSLVVVVLRSDEDDSEIDVRSLGGRGYEFMHADRSPSRGTSACANNPDDANCVSCSSSASLMATDPSCAIEGGVYSAPSDWGFNPNLRHVHMKAKYGVDPQYPIERYHVGLTSTSVPDRNGEYPSGATQYVGCLPDAEGHGCAPNCTNPLFAASLPDGSGPLTAASLCNLPIGPRANQKANVFYAHIGGVPYQLLHFDPNNLQASQLESTDWEKILGRGAAGFTGTGPVLADYTGIDPHMIESYLPRVPPYAFPVDTTNPVAPTNASDDADPISGREWITDEPATRSDRGTNLLAVDREYACRFPIAPRDCTQSYNASSCDCPSAVAGLTPDQIPPLCDPVNPTSQKYAKAYPTIRELLLAKLMGSKQGIVASLCPMEPTDTTSPVYGYRPAVAVLVDRLKTALNNQCLPEKVGAIDGGTGAVPCLVLVRLPASAGGSCKNPNCAADMGLYAPGAVTPSAATPTLDLGVLNDFCDAQEGNYVSGGGLPGAIGDPANQSVCMLRQLTSNDPTASAEFADGSCSSSTNAGWCYVTEAAAHGCGEAIQFAPKALPGGSVAYLQCIEESVNGASGGVQ